MPVTPAAPAPSPVLGRADLIAAAAAASSALVEGHSDIDTTLAGRRFRLVVPFGCPGLPSAAAPLASETAADGLGRWSWGEGNRSIRLAANAADWSDTPEVTRALGAAEAAPTIEGSAGFWLTRPWQASEACPAFRVTTPPPVVAVEDEGEQEAVEGPIPTRPLAPPPSPQTLGLVQLFTEASARTSRVAGRPHLHTVRAEGDTPLAAPAQGYRLVLEGRIERFPNGRAVSCDTPSVEVRPRCLIAVSFDYVAFRDPVGDTPLAEWR